MPRRLSPQARKWSMAVQEASKLVKLKLPLRKGSEHYKLIRSIYDKMM